MSMASQAAKVNALNWIAANASATAPSLYRLFNLDPLTQQRSAYTLAKFS